MTWTHSRALLLVVVLASAASAKGGSQAADIDKRLADARKAGDLAAQQPRAERLFALVPRRDKKLYAAELLSSLKKTGGPKSYAFFSAHHLAYTALTNATKRGEYEGLEPACALAAKRGSSKFGAYARAMAQYAAGIKAVAAGKHADAVKPFAAALAACAKEGWGRLALYCGVELALNHAAAGSADAAKKALSETLAAVREDTSVPTLYEGRAAAKRLAAAHADLHKEWDAALEKRIKSYSSNKGASAGAPGGTIAKTPLGKALDKWKKSKPLVRVTRKGSGFEVEYAFGRLDSDTVERLSGIHHVTAGGVTLAFFERGVRLQNVDVDGRRAAAGENAAPGTWQFFDKLADGETWALLPTGEVRIK